MLKFSEFRKLDESFGGEKDPPPMIVIRRIGIRNYPTGDKIALYRNEKLKLDISIPYNEKKSSGLPAAVFREEVERLDETIIKKLESIVKKGQPDNVVLINGASVQVQPSVAAKILKIYRNVRFANRVKFTNFVSEHPKQLKAVIDFTNQNDI